MLEKIKANLNAAWNTLNAAWSTLWNATKATWNSMVEGAQNNWLKIALAGIFSIALATFNVVFPPSALPTLYTLTALVASSAIYFAAQAIVAFFKKETAPAAEVATPATEEAAAPAAEVAPETTSTNTIAATLEANRTEEVAAPAAEIAAPAAEETATPLAIENAANEETEESIATPSAAM